MNKKVIGKFKDESHSLPIKEFIGLRSKMYSCLYEGGHEIKKAKGINRSVVKNTLLHQDYKSILNQDDEERKTIYVEQKNIISKKQQIYTIKSTKISLAPFDDKRYLLDNVRTLPHGHYSIGLNTSNM